MAKRAAQLISNLTTPYILLAVSTGVIMWRGNLMDLLSWAVLVMCGLVPGIGVGIWWYLTLKGEDSNPNREQRVPIYLASAVGFAVGIAITSTSTAGAVFPWESIGLSLFLLAAILFVVDITFAKASLHASGYILSVSLLGWYLHPVCFILLSFLPFIIWARIATRSHTWKEILSGTLVGIVVSLLSFGLI